MSGYIYVLSFKHCVQRGNETNLCLQPTCNSEIKPANLPSEAWCFACLANLHWSCSLLRARAPTRSVPGCELADVLRRGRDRHPGVYTGPPHHLRRHSSPASTPTGVFVNECGPGPSDPCLMAILAFVTALQFSGRLRPSLWTEV